MCSVTHLCLRLCVVHDDVGGLVHQLSHLPHRDHAVEVQIHLVGIMFVCGVRVSTSALIRNLQLTGYLNLRRLICKFPKA